MKILHLFLAVLAGGLMLVGIVPVPDFGNANSPANTYLSPHYIEKSMEETHVPNMVTAILADYRSYDTFGETTVVFTAGICVLLLLRRKREDEQ